MQEFNLAQEVLAFTHGVLNNSERGLGSALAGLSMLGRLTLQSMRLDNLDLDNSEALLDLRQAAQQLRLIVDAAAVSAADAVSFRNQALAKTLLKLGVNEPWAGDDSVDGCQPATAGTPVVFPEWKLMMQVLVPSPHNSTIFLTLVGCLRRQLLQIVTAALCTRSALPALHVQEVSGQQVKAGLVPATLAEEGVRMQYLMDCKIDTLLEQVYRAIAAPPLLHNPFGAIMAMIRCSACRMEIGQRTPQALRALNVNVLTKVGPPDSFVYAGAVPTPI